MNKLNKTILPNKNGCKSASGITLIALIITIIVLLILAGVTVAMIAGQDSAPQKAAQAKIENDIGAAKDAATLLITGYIQDYYDDKYVNNTTTANNVLEYINSKFIPSGSSTADFITKGNYKIKVDNGELTVTDLSETTIITGTVNSNGTLTWNGDATNSGSSGSTGSTTPVTPTPSESEEPVTPTVANSKPANASGAVTALSTTDNITIEDTLGNEIIVPAGFGIAYDSGENVEDGIVIEDATEGSTKGSQFVWIPLGDKIKVSEKVTSRNEDGTIEIELSRYSFDNNGIASKKEPEDTISGAIENKNRSSAIKDENGEISFINQANEKGGYYIARYEAGIAETTESNINSSYKINNKSYDKNNATIDHLVTKKGVGVWNLNKKSNMLTLCRAMYNNDENSNFKADLISSYAWDTAIVFIQKCENNNYSIQKRLNARLSTTGNSTDGTNIDVHCNIYDMAGNVMEATTEFYRFNWL